MNDHSTSVGTVGGTLLTIITVSANTVVATVIVAIIGATTSFFVSLLLKWLTTKVKAKIKKI